MTVRELSDKELLEGYVKWTTRIAIRRLKNEMVFASRVHSSMHRDEINRRGLEVPKS